MMRLEDEIASPFGALCKFSAALAVKLPGITFMASQAGPPCKDTCFQSTSSPQYVVHNKAPTWMSQEVSKTLGSVGYTPKYTPFISTWNPNDLYF